MNSLLPLKINSYFFSIGYEIQKLASTSETTTDFTRIIPDIYSNNKGGKYQFEYIKIETIFMSIKSFVIWQLKENLFHFRGKPERVWFEIC